MFEIAVLIGLYSYVIFFLGIVGLLSLVPVAVVSATFLFYVVCKVREVGRVSSIQIWFRKLGKFEKLLFFLILVQSTVNLIGTLGPELAFDSLWYHLTIPKIFIQEHKIFHIPGNLFYYSDMPKLIEMLYIPSLMFGNEIIAKLIHFLFGIGCLFVIYKLSRKFVDSKLSLLACLIFYSNLVVAWLSITSYIDLGRTFFEVLAWYYLLEYFEDKKQKFLLFSAISLGLAIGSKELAIVSLFVFLPLILYKTKSVVRCTQYLLVSLTIPMPWFIFSFVNTGNPFYPFFSGVVSLSQGISINNLLNFVHSPDPISPIYLIALPLVVVGIKKFGKEEKITALYCLLSFIVWFITPQTGGGRFVTAYLPAFSILVVVAIKYLKQKLIRNLFVLTILFVSLVSITYRGAANLKYLPFELGLKSTKEFLTDNLNFSFGDFFDTDGYFSKHIKSSDTVLTYGIHNLYYADFPFMDGSYRNKKSKFNYVLARGDVPKEFYSWKVVYVNNKTNVKLYVKK